MKIEITKKDEGKTEILLEGVSKELVGFAEK